MCIAVLPATEVHDCTFELNTVLPLFIIGYLQAFEGNSANNKTKYSWVIFPFNNTTDGNFFF